MSRLLRWKYILPRLTLVSVLVVAIHFGLDPILRWTIVASGEAAVGAKVELAELETSLLEGQLVLGNLAIANPDSPLNNMLQTDLVRLRLDTNALLHKRLVVQDGSLYGLQFDTPRTTSGALAAPAVEEAQDSSPAWLTAWTDSIGEQATHWFEQSGDTLGENLAAQLQTPHVAEQIQQNWESQYTELREQVASLQTQAKEVEAEIREIRKNPLRHLDRLQQLQRGLTAAQTQIKSLQEEIARLPLHMKEDRRSIAAALEYDQRFVRQQLQIDRLDGDQLTQHLLGKEAGERLSQVLAWIGKARDLAPSKPKVERSRGTNVLFVARNQPRMHIQRLSLQGTARVSGQTVGLAGSLTDYSSHPALLAEPTRLKLSATEGSEMQLVVVLDRRDAIARDTLHLECPQLLLPGRTLGDEAKLAIAIGPGAASLQADLRLEEDRLMGEILFAQKSVRLKLTAKAAKQQRLAEVMDQALASVESVDAKLVLAGTMESPELNIESDLGAQLAGKLNEGVRRLIEQQSEALLAESQRAVDRQLAALDQSRQTAQQSLLAKLGESQQLVGKLAGLAGGSPGSGLQQLGSSLRSGLQRK